MLIIVPLLLPPRLQVRWPNRLWMLTCTLCTWVSAHWLTDTRFRHKRWEIGWAWLCKYVTTIIYSTWARDYELFWYETSVDTSGPMEFTSMQVVPLYARLLLHMQLRSCFLVQVTEELKKLNCAVNIPVMCGGLLAPRNYFILYILAACGGVVPSQDHQFQAFYDDNIAALSPYINSIIARAAYQLVEIMQQNLNDPEEPQAIECWIDVCILQTGLITVHYSWQCKTHMPVSQPPHLFEYANTDIRVAMLCLIRFMT